MINENNHEIAFYTAIILLCMAMISLGAATPPVPGVLPLSKTEKISRLVAEALPDLPAEKSSFLQPADPQITAALTQLVDNFIKLVTNAAGKIDFDKIGKLTPEQLRTIVPAELQAQEAHPEQLAFKIMMGAVRPDTIRPLITKLLTTITILDPATEQSLRDKIAAWMQELDKHKDLIPDHYLKPTATEFVALRAAVNPALRSGAIVGMVSLLLNKLISQPNLTLANLQRNTEAQIETAMQEIVATSSPLFNDLNTYLTTKHYVGGGVSHIITDIVATFMPDSWFNAILAHEKAQEEQRALVKLPKFKQVSRPAQPEPIK